VLGVLALAFSVFSAGVTSSSRGACRPPAVRRKWGRPAPDFTLPDVTGKPVTLSELRKDESGGTVDFLPRLLVTLL
jgi:hypothetical protein